MSSSPEFSVTSLVTSSAPAKLRASVQTGAMLAPADIAAMYHLFAAHYDCTDAASFASDLAEKSHVILFHDGARLCGFSTLTLLALEPNGSTPACSILFSGDTIITPDYWGEQALALAFCRFVGGLKAAQPAVPLYWLLISKGYRTYRYLHLFARHYWPHYWPHRPDTQATTANATATDDTQLELILHRAASQKFGTAWDRATGLIRFPQSHGQLRPDLALVRPHLREHTDIAFFLEKNLRYAQGEELACITLLDLPNLRGVARRAFVQGFDAASQPGDHL